MFLLISLSMALSPSASVNIYLWHYILPKFLLLCFLNLSQSQFSWDWTFNLNRPFYTPPYLTLSVWGM